MAEYRLSPAAEGDLEHIWRHTVGDRGRDQADRYVKRLDARCIALAAAPLQAPACDDIRPGYRRRREGSHVIYFRETPYGIAVIRILHQSMDAAQHL